MPSSSLPLSNHLFIHTTSLDEGIHLYSTSETPIRLASADRRLFEWRWNRVLSGPIALSASRFGGRVSLDSVAPTKDFVLTRPLHGGGAILDNRRATYRLKADGSAVLISPSSPTHMQISAGFECVNVRITGAALEKALGGLLGSQPRAPLRFEPRVHRSGAGGGLMALVDFLTQDAEREHGAMSFPIVATTLQSAFLYHLIEGQPHNHSALLHPRPSGHDAPSVRRIEEYLDAHYEEPITLADLVQLTGLSGRAIQAAFRTHRGYPPMKFLRDRRFARARQLLSSAPASSVTEVAFSCGFEHIGRFSVEYRARFGESPSETRRGAFGPAAAASRR